LIHTIDIVQRLLLSIPSLLAAMEHAMPLEERLALRDELINADDKFMLELPKVELHVHIEGTLTPELRWKLAQRNGQTLTLERTGTVYTSLEQLRASYTIIEARPGNSIDNAEETFTFFEAYYGGFEVLVTEQDFFDLAMHYYEKVAPMRVRYCELFFDPQGHTRRGVSWETMMNGFRAAQEKAEKDLGVGEKETRPYTHRLTTLIDQVKLDHVLPPR
jgi:adenosine deaminase